MTILEISIEEKKNNRTGKYRILHLAPHTIVMVYEAM